MAGYSLPLSGKTRVGQHVMEPPPVSVSSSPPPDLSSAKLHHKPLQPRDLTDSLPGTLAVHLQNVSLQHFVTPSTLASSAKVGPFALFEGSAGTPALLPSLQPLPHHQASFPTCNRTRRPPVAQCIPSLKSHPLHPPVSPASPAYIMFAASTSTFKRTLLTSARTLTATSIRPATQAALYRPLFTPKFFSNTAAMSKEGVHNLAS